MEYVIVIIALLLIVVLAFNFGSKHGPQKTQLVEEIERQQREKDDNVKELLKRFEVLDAKCELMSQAKAVGDMQTYEKVKNDEYEGELPTRPAGEWLSMYDDLMILKIAGINYRGNLSAYVGWFKGVLKPEPKNDYDSNAIMVKCEDGKHLGYVPEEMTTEIRAFIGAEGVDFSPYRINGQIDECGDEDDGRKFFVGRVFVVRKK